eukprot:3811372-Pleurochrysis_carterae.AAC.3
MSSVSHASLLLVEKVGKGRAIVPLFQRLEWLELVRDCEFNRADRPRPGARDLHPRDVHLLREMRGNLFMFDGQVEPAEHHGQLPRLEVARELGLEPARRPRVLVAARVGGLALVAPLTHAARRVAQPAEPLGPLARQDGLARLHQLFKLSLAAPRSRAGAAIRTPEVLLRRHVARRAHGRVQPPLAAVDVARKQCVRERCGRQRGHAAALLRTRTRTQHFRVQRAHGDRRRLAAVEFIRIAEDCGLDRF